MPTPSLTEVVQKLQPGQGVAATGGGPTLPGAPLTTAPDPRITGAPTSPQGPLTTQDLAAQFNVQGEEARAANKAREQEVRGLTQQVVDIFQPGGGFGQGFDAQLARLKQQNIAGETQSLVTSGLANTTTAATLGRRFEQDIGIPARLQAEDIRSERLAGALTQQAGTIERFEDIGPDPGLVASLVTEASDTPVGETAKTIGGEDITDAIFKEEQKRRSKSNRFTKQTAGVGRDIEKVQKKLEAAVVGSKQEARLQKQLAKLQGRSGKLSGKLAGLGESVIADDIFEAETGRRKEAKRAAEQAASAERTEAKRREQATGGGGLTRAEVRRRGLPESAVGTQLVTRVGGTFGGKLKDFSGENVF